MKKPSLGVVTKKRSQLLSKKLSKKKKNLSPVTKSIAGETLELGIIILDLLLQISSMKKKANSLIGTTMVNLSVVGTLMANQSMRCYLPLKKWE